MLTKYILHFKDYDYELKAEDLRNWDEILCTYTRKNYDGVVRSCSSQYEFVNHAKDLLLDLYLAERFNAKASLSINIINNNWEYDEVFNCPLDFSTVEWNAFSFKINSLDNSLAALIKANKSTKYEFEVGTDIQKDFTLHFTRLPITETLEFKISEGTNEDDGSLTVPAPENDRTYCGVQSDDEIFIGGFIIWNDDQTKEADSYMIEAKKDVELTVNILVEYDQCHDKTLDGYFSVIHTDSTSEIAAQNASFNMGTGNMFKCGDYATEAALREAWPASSITPDGENQKGYWATVDGVVWAVSSHGPNGVDWESRGVEETTFRKVSISKEFTVSLQTGDKMAFVTSGTGAHIYSSSFKFSWKTKGEICDIPAMSPDNVAESLLVKICGGKINPRVYISGHDSRLANTVIMAAESIRDIPGAKLYTSFNEFCDWMSAVFGYVWYIDGKGKDIVSSYKEALGGCIKTNYPLSEEVWSKPGETVPTAQSIVYFECYGKFAAFDGTTWHLHFPNETLFNDPKTGFARTDTIFKLRRWKNGVRADRLYYFETDIDGTLIYEPKEYRGSIDDIYKPYQLCRFVHRSEIMSSTANVRRFPNVCDVKYSVDTSAIYSTVTAGYDKKDYETINGRDEFNFNNTYTTGCSLSDKTLSLLSKYRADCYGIEFAAQKRGADTTDSTSDKDVFFALTTTSTEGVMTVDTTCEIENASSGEVFNGAFSPMACVKANSGLIGLQADGLKLVFASSTGNSSIVIDGVAMNSDIELNSPMATCGIVEFTTDEVDVIADPDELIEIEDSGTVYRGFLKDVDIKYAKSEAAKYQIIVKEIES